MQMMAVNVSGGLVEVRACAYGGVCNRCGDLVDRLVWMEPIGRRLRQVVQGGTFACLACCELQLTDLVGPDGGPYVQMALSVGGRALELGELLQELRAEPRA